MITLIGQTLFSIFIASGVFIMILGIGTKEKDFVQGGCALIALAIFVALSTGYLLLIEG